MRPPKPEITERIFPVRAGREAVFWPLQHSKKIYLLFQVLVWRSGLCFLGERLLAVLGFFFLPLLEKESKVMFCLNNVLLCNIIYIIHFLNVKWNNIQQSSELLWMWFLKLSLRQNLIRRMKCLSYHCCIHLLLAFIMVQRTSKRLSFSFCST